MYTGMVAIVFNNDRKFDVKINGNIKQLESKLYHFYIFGSIQHEWFFEDSRCVEQLDKYCYDENFYQSLNGHFSLVIIEKSTGATRLVANHSGGVRLYVQSLHDKLIVSTQLELFNLSAPELDFNTLNEVMNYRWNSGENSLLSGIMQVPSSCYWQFDQSCLIEKVCYYYFPYSGAVDINPIAVQAEEVEELLTTAMTDAIKPNARVAVLLSGGVDSSILTALANQLQNNLVAISHRSDDHQNPELETAIQFAKELGIEHQIYTINNDDILDAFIKTNKIIEQPIRFQSSLLLYKLFEHMSGKFDQIIYGEAADTLFGSGTVKRFKIRQEKQIRLRGLTKKIPFAKQVINLMPEHNKLRMLQNDNIHNYLSASTKISYRTQNQQHIETLCKKKATFNGI